MRASPVDTSLRVLTWCCVILLAILSLLPDQQMVRIGLPGRVEHFVAYAGSAAIAVAGYGAIPGGVQIIGGFWVYAAVLEYLQHFSPGRHPAIGDFAASALGALCSGLANQFFGAGPSFSKAAGPTVEPASVSEQISQRRSIDRLIPDNFKLCDQRTATFKQEIEIFESVLN